VSSSPYRRYVVRFQRVSRAVREADAERLRALELELPDLPEEEQRIARMAIHDVTRRVPMRGAAHFARTFGEAQGSSSPLFRSHSS